MQQPLTRPTGSRGNRHKSNRRKVLSLVHSAPKSLSSEDGGEEGKRPDTKQEQRREKPPCETGKGLPRGR